MSEKMDYTPDLYTLVDEEGKEQTFELLDVMEVDDERYFALVPYIDEEELVSGDGELVILKAQMEGEEEILASIEDDEEFERIGQMFLKRIEESFEEDGCECDDEDCDCCHHHE